VQLLFAQEAVAAAKHAAPDILPGCKAMCAVGDRNVYKTLMPEAQQALFAKVRAIARRGRK